MPVTREFQAGREPKACRPLRRHPQGQTWADLTDELAWACRVQDLNTAAVLADPRAERQRLAEPDLEFWAFCTGCL
jgi:hypothetical protein